MSRLGRHKGVGVGGGGRRAIHVHVGMSPLFATVCKLALSHACIGFF